MDCEMSSAWSSLCLTSADVKRNLCDIYVRVVEGGSVNGLDWSMVSACLHVKPSAPPGGVITHSCLTGAAAGLPSPGRKPGQRSSPIIDHITGGNKTLSECGPAPGGCREGAGSTFSFLSPTPSLAPAPYSVLLRPPTHSLPYSLPASSLPESRRAFCPLSLSFHSRIVLFFCSSSSSRKENQFP